MTDHITKYCTEAFRFYARVGGLESYAKGKEDALAEAAAYARSEGNAGIKSGPSDPTAAAYSRMESERKESGLMSEYQDLQAVEMALEIIARLKNSRDINRALQRVYYLDADRELERGDIQGRVAAASIWIPASERQIYRWLADARAILARERGLRLEEWHYNRLKRMLL